MRILAVFLLLLLPNLLWAAAFKVTDSSGSPFYRAKGSLKKQPVVKGESLNPGGRIKMADGDRLVLSTPMGDTIELSGDTYMRLEDLNNDKKSATTVKLELFKGISTNKVSKLGAESSFIIRTPSAVAGVRGTEFQVAVSETGETEVAVMEGEVGVSDADGTSAPVPVSAGKSAKVKKGGGISVKIVKNVRKRAEARAAKSAKVTPKSSAGTDSASTNEASDTESTDSEAEDVSGSVDEAVGEVSQAVEAAIEEAQEQIQLQIDEEAIEELLIDEEAIEELLIDEEAIEELLEENGSSIQVDLESINR